MSGTSVCIRRYTSRRTAVNVTHFSPGLKHSNILVYHTTPHSHPSSFPLPENVHSPILLMLQPDLISDLSFRCL